MSGNQIYRIKDWDHHFENNRTRDMKNMAWIPVPNKHDGDGYTELVDHEHGAAHLGAWLVILQTASKCGIRGTLLRDNGQPHTARTISRLTRLSEVIISETLERLCCCEIGWLEVIDNEGHTQIPHLPAEIPHPTDEEGKGTERNGTEKKGKKYTVDFLSFWKSYPRKVGKGAAFKAWNSAKDRPDIRHFNAD
jgi:hypothetical protein